jgi:hypothetical protein
MEGDADRIMNLQALRLLAWLGLGAGFGAAYLRVLAWNVRLYCARFTPLALLLHLLRFLSTAAVFVALARTGAAPLLSSFVGFQLTRVFGCAGKLPAWEAPS